jgi:uncharacterized membrane protein
MRIQLENVKKIGRKIDISDEKGFAVAVFLALIIVFSIFAGYYLITKPQPEPYSTIYLLDYPGKNAINYPETLVANQNSKVSVYVGVEDHLGGMGNQSYEVLMKVTSNLSSFPVNVQPSDTYMLSLANDGKWENLATITQNTPGSYSVVFELWHLNQASGAYEFTTNACVLNVQVVS